MFKESTGNIYYSCKTHNDIENCAKCDNKEECKECLNGYSFAFIDGNYFCEFEFFKYQDFDKKSDIIEFGLTDIVLKIEEYQLYLLFKLMEMS